MLCSISTGRSGGNWLDRLRSSKGFPSGDDLDLEQFLNHPNPSLSDSSDTKISNIDTETNSNLIAAPEEELVHDRNQTTEIPNQNGEKLLGVMSNVLAELFNMGDSDDFPRMNGKKSCRKQPNPKICVVVSNVEERCSDDARRDEGGCSATLRSSGDNSCMEIKQMSDQTTKPKNVSVGPVYVEEEEKTHADLSTFSRIQVTVIDTSCQSWRFEKLLFRRKNVWKVRDKKGQSLNFIRKKRKATLLDENLVGNGEKEATHSIGQCSLAAKEANGVELVAPSNERPPRSDRTEEACKQTPNILCQVPEKRFPRKSKKAGSSVVLLKSLPTSKKHGASIHKSCLKSTQIQHNV